MRRYFLTEQSIAYYSCIVYIETEYALDNDNLVWDFLKNPWSEHWVYIIIIIFSLLQRHDWWCGVINPITFLLKPAVNDLGRVLYAVSTVIYTNGMTAPMPNIEVMNQKFWSGLLSAIPVAEKHIWTSTRRKMISTTLYTDSLYGLTTAALLRLEWSAAHLQLQRRCLV